MVVGWGDLRKGLAIEMDGEPYQVVEYSQQKMQQRAPVVRLRLRELRTGKMVERNFSGYGVRFNVASVEQRSAQYLYRDQDTYYFMDSGTYEQYALSQQQLGDALSYLKEQVEVQLLFYKEQPISLELPTFVDLKVVETAPGFRGDTAQGGTKPARLETGLTVNVPFFVNTGEVVRVDTRSGEYLERVG
ncbi:MAG: elongation factor P [Chloroflexi bacterium]|nr:elongation factor P [Chloroflexota bacterium]